MQKPISEIGVPIKYDFNVCVNKLEFVSEESRNKFRDDFDETYNVFLVKLTKLLTQYGVAKIDTGLSEYLLGRNPTF